MYINAYLTPVRARRRGRAPLFLLTLALLATLLTLLAGCGGPNFGDNKNHLHDLLALRGVPNTVLVASHFGLFRTEDGGKTWSEVAGGAGQAMDGLMISKLAQSPADPKRVYVLALARPEDKSAAKDTIGVYMSDDAGKTWKLASAAASLPGQTLYTVATGAGSAGQLYTLLPGQGANGLYASDDAGAHWHGLAVLPASNIGGVVSDPAHAGRLLLYSLSSGLYASSDGGQHWNKAAGITGGVSAATVSGSTVYAAGDLGVYASSDGGASFTLANRDTLFNAIVVSPSDPTHAYALNGQAVFTTTDGGHTWKKAAAPSRHAEYLTLDPANPTRAYIGYSYPIGVQTTSDAGAHWQSVLP